MDWRVAVESVLDLIIHRSLPHLPVRDDWLAEGHTNDQGQISLRGRKNQFSVISPHFNIYHDCNDSDHVRGLDWSR